MKQLAFIIVLLISLNTWSQTVKSDSEFKGIIMQKGKKSTPIAIGENLTVSTTNQNYYGKLDKVSSEQLSISGNAISLNQITSIQYMSKSREEKQKMFQMSALAGLGVAITSVVLAVNSDNDNLITAFGILATFSFIYAPVGTVIGYRLRDPKKMAINRGWKMIVAD